jgi:hypothetical protein
MVSVTGEEMRMAGRTRGLVVQASEKTIIDPLPLMPTGRNWTRLAGPAVSLLILLAVAYQMRTFKIADMRALLPTSIGFWLVFAIYYMAGPTSEWIIFRRLWNIPISGIGALMRKLVSNEILLGYLGEVYFYAWARRNAQITAAPFGAIKDVTILSALVGNMMTLAMIVAAAPLISAFDIGISGRSFALSAAAVLLLSMMMLVMRNRLFTLPRSDLWMIACVHLARILTTTLLTAVMWHMLLPTIGLSWLAILGTLRLLVSRLPLLPNKDVAFAGFATFFVGNDVQIGSALALMAALILAAHLGVGAALGAAELSREARTK